MAAENCTGAEHDRNQAKKPGNSSYAIPRLEISGKSLTQSCEMSLRSLKAQRSSEVTQQTLNYRDNKDAQGDMALPPDFSPAVN